MPQRVLAGRTPVQTVARGVLIRLNLIMSRRPARRWSNGGVCSCVFLLGGCSRPQRPSWRPLRQAVSCVGQLLPHPTRCGLRSSVCVCVCVCVVYLWGHTLTYTRLPNNSRVDDLLSSPLFASEFLSVLPHASPIRTCLALPWLLCAVMTAGSLPTPRISTRHG